jgi:4'-phosphopantetheinyl transferase
VDELAGAALRPGEVHVWYVDLDGDPPAGSDAAACLDAAERARADRFVREVDRRRFRASHCAFRHLLAGYLGCPAAAVGYSRRCDHCGHPEHGKPVATDPAGGRPVDVSFSHSDGLGALAVARLPLGVGVDVERRRPNVDWAGILAAVHDTPAGPPADPQPDPATDPATHPATDPAPVDGFERWTRLEAVGKAAGTGIVRTPRLGEPDAAGWAPAELPPGKARDDHPASPASCWWVRRLDPPEGYAAALAASEVPTAGVLVRRMS